MRLTKIHLERVHYMPKELQPGILYVSEEFGAAAHLCACGCGVKVRTPLGPTEWAFQEGTKGPSLRPSIGNWQQKCESHYWIRNGTIEWSGAWSPEQIAAGRLREEVRRRAYYSDSLPRQGFFVRISRWIRKLLGTGEPDDNDSAS